MTGIILLFELLGINTGTETLLNYVGISLENGIEIIDTMRTLVFVTVLGVVALGGIAIGTFTRAKPENYVVLTFITTFFVYYVYVFVHITQEAYTGGAGWSSYVVLLLLAPLQIGWFMSVLDYFRGID